LLITACSPVIAGAAGFSFVDMACCRRADFALVRASTFRLKANSVCSSSLTSSRSSDMPVALDDVGVVWSLGIVRRRPRTVQRLKTFQTHIVMGCLSRFLQPHQSQRLHSPSAGAWSSDLGAFFQGKQAVSALRCQPAVIFVFLPDSPGSGGPAHARCGPAALDSLRWLPDSVR